MGEGHGTGGKDDHRGKDPLDAGDVRFLVLCFVKRDAVDCPFSDEGNDDADDGRDDKAFAYAELDFQMFKALKQGDQ